MKKGLISLSLGIFLAGLVGFGFTNEASAAVRVRGYYRNNGTYVQPYYRSNPDSSRYNNYSTKGNYNPYTGRVGTKSIRW